MFKKFTNGCVNVVNKFLPDAFLFAVILTFVVFLAAWGVSGSANPITVIQFWGQSSGFWGLLAFSMQMALVVVLGGAMANAGVCKVALGKIAAQAKSPKSAIIITCAVSTICCWLNWGFGLIVGALLAKEIARRVKGVDYRLLIASAYSGFVVWHAGISGSIPLTLSGGYTIGETTYQAGTGMTIFHPVNLIICIVILVGMPLLCVAMAPDAEHTVVVDPALLVEKEKEVKPAVTPADKMERSKVLWAILLVMGFAYIIWYFAIKKGSLDLNTVNFIFMFVGLLLHGNIRNYIDAVNESATSAAGIILQFPFYAGIMGMMVGVGPSGVSLAQIISNFFVNISTPMTFPLFTFLSAGIVNFFVPSGGGQWAVQGPIVMPAAAQLGVAPGQAAMALAWGDAWTNMIQPFWALPALGVAGLSAKDIMGYCVVVLLGTGVVVCAGMLVWAGMFPA